LKNGEKETPQNVISLYTKIFKNQVLVRLFFNFFLFIFGTSKKRQK